MNGRTAVHWIALSVNVATVNAVLLIQLHASGWGIGGSLEETLVTLAFAVWALSPYMPMLLVSIAFLWWKAFGIAPSVVKLVGTLLVCGFGLFVYIDAFFIHIDAQNGVAFVFVPVLQWVGVFATLLLEVAIYFLIARRGRRVGRA